MNKLLTTFLAVFLLASLAVALEHVIVTDPTTDQKIGTTVSVKWDTTQIPKGVKSSDEVSVRLRCGKRGIPPKAVPREPFSTGKKDIFIPNDYTLVGVSCKADLNVERSGITGLSKPFKLIN
uniref:Uncharacterized protein n=1 Tax=Anthurium amnicola TaxID=1678845 RepID=A0A1D1Y128_9ARAE